MENPVWSVIKWPRKKEGILEILSQLSAFYGLTNNELLLVQRMLHERTYKKGEVIFNEGEPGAGMYIVISGGVEITRTIGGDTQTTLAVIKELSFFGELALLDEIPRSASAIALYDTVLFGFSKPSLESLCQRNPRLGIKILSNLSKLISKRLLKTNEAMEKLQLRMINKSNLDKKTERFNDNV